MDCKTARMLVDFARPHASELDPSETQSLDEHLGSCAECGRLAQRERRLDGHLALAMRAVPIPIDLQERLQTRLLNERNQVYRKQIVRWATAAAAAVLIGLGIWQLLPARDQGPRPISLERLTALQQPPPRQASELNNYFGRQDVLVGEIPDVLVKELEKEINFDLVQAGSVQRLGGFIFPTLHLKKDQSSARLILLPKGSYAANEANDLQQEQKKYPTGSKRYVFGSPGVDAYIALLVIESGSYADFQKPSKPLTASFLLKAPLLSFRATPHAGVHARTAARDFRSDLCRA